MTLDLADPVGWTVIPLAMPGSDLDCPDPPPAPSSSSSSAVPVPLRAHLLQLQVVAMHQNGRDTHIRQVC